MPEWLPRIARWQHSLSCCIVTMMSVCNCLQGMSLKTESKPARCSAERTSLGGKLVGPGSCCIPHSPHSGHVRQCQVPFFCDTSYYRPTFCLKSLQKEDRRATLFRGCLPLSHVSHSDCQSHRRQAVLTSSRTLVKQKPGTQDRPCCPKLASLTGRSAPVLEFPRKIDDFSPQCYCVREVVSASRLGERCFCVRAVRPRRWMWLWVVRVVRAARAL